MTMFAVAVALAVVTVLALAGQSGQRARRRRCCPLGRARAAADRRRRPRRTLPPEPGRVGDGRGALAWKRLRSTGSPLGTRRLPVPKSSDIRRIQAIQSARIRGFAAVLRLIEPRTWHVPWRGAPLRNQEVVGSSPTSSTPRVPHGDAGFGDPLLSRSRRPPGCRVSVALFVVALRNPRPFLSRRPLTGASCTPLTEEVPMRRLIPATLAVGGRDRDRGGRGQRRWSGRRRLAFQREESAPGDGARVGSVHAVCDDDSPWRQRPLAEQRRGQPLRRQRRRVQHGGQRGHGPGLGADGGTLTLKFSHPGTFVYYCKLHAQLDEFGQPVAPGPDRGRNPGCRRQLRDADERRDHRRAGQPAPVQRLIARIATGFIRGLHGGPDGLSMRRRAADQP